MTTIVIRQSGGAAIVSLPKAVLKTMGLNVGSNLDLSIGKEGILLKPIKDELTLESLLEGSPKEKLILSEEDKAWLNDSAVGKEDF
jgi:antitoxin ChpS